MELRTRALLARAPDLTAAHVRELAAIPGALTGDWRKAARALPPLTRAGLQAPDTLRLAADLEWLERSGAHLLLVSDSEYPPLLAQIADAPPCLYVLGSVTALREPQLAMVGSRSPSPGGRSTAREFASWFARAGLTVTSGLALGIDAACHEGALTGGGLTVAVCGTGLDQIYPAANAGLAARIRERGALVSEFPPGTPPRRGNFPRRNRIISGLAHGTLVVEAARNSGSLITARCAGEQGREVFAIPGSIHNPLARGCHQLIRSGAKLVEEAADILSELRISLSAEALTPPPERADRAPVTSGALDKDYEMLLDALGFEPATIDVLGARTGLDGASIASMLLILELKGRVAALPGGRYGRTYE